VPVVGEHRLPCTNATTEYPHIWRRLGHCLSNCVVLDEITGDMREGLLALAVGAGLQVMTAMMEADVTAVTG